jgi:hypothetical protein
MKRLLAYLCGVSLLGQTNPQALLISQKIAASGESISFVGAADLGNNGGGGDLTASYTVGSGTDRILWVMAQGDLIGGADDCDSTPTTFNGVNMSIGKHITVGYRYITLWYLVNPASGAHNVVMHCVGNHYQLAGAADYAGAKQSGVPDNSGSNSNNGSTGELDTAITPVAAGSWILYVANGTDGLGNALASANGNTTRRTFDAAFKIWALADTNGTASGSTTMGLKFPGAAAANMGAAVVSFAPGP